MATSANPTFQNFSPRTQVCLHVSLKTAQAASMIVPPVYLGLSLFRRRPVSVSGLMRRAEVGVIGGAALGYGLGYARLNGQSEVAIADRVYRLKHNQGQVRADDYSIIGAALGMLLSPAIFLKRANIVTLVAGGAAIGLGGGIWAHLAKSFTKGEDVKPEAMASELPALPGKK